MHHSYATPYNSPDHCRQLYWSDTVQWSHSLFGTETNVKCCIWVETNTNKQLTTCVISRRSVLPGRLSHPLRSRLCTLLAPTANTPKAPAQHPSSTVPSYAVPRKNTHTHTHGSCCSIPQRASEKAFKETRSFSSCQGQDQHEQYITLLTKFTFLVLSSSLLPVHWIQETSKSVQNRSQAAPLHSNWTPTLQQPCRFRSPPLRLGGIDYFKTLCIDLIFSSFKRPSGRYVNNLHWK